VITAPRREDMAIHNMDTLAYQLGIRPMARTRDLSTTELSRTAAAIKAFRDQHHKIKRPETEALWFYMTNHAVGKVRRRVEWDEPLGKYLPILDTYNGVGALLGARLFAYLVLICLRESRHAKISPGVRKFLKDKYGTEAVEFNDHIRKGNDPVNAFTNSTPNMTLGNFVWSLRDIFYMANFSSGYGGSKWGNVNDVLCAFVDGKFSAEMMLDVGWTLAHNGGPIFNKGMLYNHYSSKYLHMILDVQASGQIPQLLSGGAHAVSDYISEDMKGTMETIVALLGNDFQGDVDWALVQAHSVSGATYSDMMNPAQKTTANKLVKEIKEAAAAKAKAEAIEAAKTSFTIMPTPHLLVVPKISRDELKEVA